MQLCSKASQQAVQHFCKQSRAEACCGKLCRMPAVMTNESSRGPQCQGAMLRLHTRYNTMRRCVHVSSNPTVLHPGRCACMMADSNNEVSAEMWQHHF